MEYCHYINNSSNLTKRTGVLKIEVGSGKILKEYKYLADIIEDGFSVFNISQVLIGKSETSGGFVWKYKLPVENFGQTD